MSKKIIIFSHGMGVLKDNRGLFPFLIEKLKPFGYETLMFDYNDINEETREVTVKPFSEQAKILQTHIDSVKSSGYNEINIIGQSQGSLIPAFCDVSGIKRVIGISAFFHTDKKDILARYSKSKDNIINFDGITKRKRSDGTTTIMPKSYWDERFLTKPDVLYNQLAQSTQFTLINALQDEIMDFTNLKKIKYTRIINTDGDHDFSGVFREILAEIIIKELMNSSS